MLKTIIYCILFSFITACSVSKPHPVNYHFESANGEPDYSNLNYWAAHPEKYDPSDSMPKKLKKSYKPDTTADVFFLYPTSFLDKDFQSGWNARIDDEIINRKTDQTAVLYQASIFNSAGRVFAPRYRQANYYCYFTHDTAAALAAFDLAYTDIKAAFQYYLDHYNNGRPIIIASHSQGTTHAKRLMREFFDGKPLQKQLVAAYLAGMPVQPDWFSDIPACTSPGQTGCFCSWRTFKKGYTDSFVQKEQYTAVVTNPLTWDSSKPYADRFANRGSVLYKFKKTVPKVAGAEIHQGVLWTPKPRFFGSFLLKTTNYHIADYNFYYLSIRENAMERLKAYKAHNK
ncbi:MAG TPA: DUF3089 domain-containing protein [Panacibacter sp.]|nr:DUF3089 domain-containing protein [Panacibacter sp.]HNP43880.1 DUF3089 domain-containing protein [Panacibacter sp.]